MPLTQLRTDNLGDASITRDDINISTSGKALITKVVAGTGITFSQTGADVGTGDVTINASGTLTVNTGTSGSDLNIVGSPASLGGTITINIPDAGTGTRGLVNNSAQTFQGVKSLTSRVNINSNNAIYRTTSSGSNISTGSVIDIDGGTSAGNLAVIFESGNGLVFTASNGTNRIMRSAIKLSNLVNTSGSESADLSFLTQSAGAVATEKYRIGSDGKIYINTIPSSFSPNSSGISNLVLNNSTKEVQYYQYDKFEFGDIYNKTTWANLTDFAVNTAGATIVSNQISIPTGGVGDFSKPLSLSGYYNSNHWKSIMEVKLTSLNTNGISIGTGSNTTTSGSNCDIALYFNNLTATRGQLQIFERHNSNTTTFNSVATSATNLSVSTNDIVRLTIERENQNIYCTAENITTNSSAIMLSYTFPSAGGAIPPSVQRFTVYSHSGTYTISKLQIIEKEQQNPLIVCVGDSKTLGYGATAWNKTWAFLVGKYYNSVAICAGFGERIADVTNRINEILNLKPQYIILSIGSNDKRAGVADATTFSNYQSLNTSLGSGGAQVIHLSGFYESGQDNSSLSGSVVSTYGANVINTFNITHKYGLYADGIHLNDNAHTATFNYIQDSNLLPGYDRYNEYT